MMGGSVDGGKILGHYPRDLTDDGELNLGRGRIMPTTSFDSIWHGIAEWMGADTDVELEYCLPNHDNVVGGTNNLFSPMFGESDLFRSDQTRRLEAAAAVEVDDGSDTGASSFFGNLQKILGSRNSQAHN